MLYPVRHVIYCQNQISLLKKQLPTSKTELNSHMSWLIWTIMLVSLAIVTTMPRESGIRTLVASIILRFIFSVGPEPTLWLLGSVTVLLKGVHIVSLMGNHGTLEKHFLKIICDAQLLYHFCYMIFCLSGILVHPFFYSVLVRVFERLLRVTERLQKYFSFLSAVIRCRVSRRNSIECHSLGNSQWKVNYFNGSAGTHFGLSILDHRLHFLQRRFPCDRRR